MKYILLLWLLTGCLSLKTEHTLLKKGDCIQTSVESFYSEVCRGAIFRVDDIWHGISELYTVNTYYMDIRRGCPAEFRIDAKESTKVQCPSDF